VAIKPPYQRLWLWLKNEGEKGAKSSKLKEMVHIISPHYRGAVLDQKRGAKKTMLAASELKKIAQQELQQVGKESPCEPMALVAAFPEPIMALSDADKKTKVRQGMDSVIFKDDTSEGVRGFVRAVLKVPLDHPNGQTFGIFVEVSRDSYEKLQDAFAKQIEVEVEGTLANRLPLLEKAYGTKLWLKEFGDHRRVSVIRAEHPLLINGPDIGKNI